MIRTTGTCCPRQGSPPPLLARVRGVDEKTTTDPGRNGGTTTAVVVGAVAPVMAGSTSFLLDGRTLRRPHNGPVTMKRERHRLDGGNWVFTCSQPLRKS